MAALIKEGFTVLNLLLLLLLCALIAYRYQKKGLSKKLLYTAGIVFLLCSTPFLPNFLAAKLEKQFLPFHTAAAQQSPGKIYIHLLGSGFTDDERLPPTSQLGIVARSRLVEAMRIYHQLNNSVLVCSAGNPGDGETQAMVAKKAAILLGADSSRIITLNTPTTTKQEAIALASITGSAARVVIVTDAIHMPRAYKLFTEQGFHPIAAPANFKVLKPRHHPSFHWAPSISNISLMDVLIHEYLGNIKAMFS